MATLYRKYRPLQFREVVGQNHVKITLQNEIQAGKIAHAYIFCGPRAVGKTTVARVFAKTINCLKRKEGNFEPCNGCEICEEITVGRSLDILEIDAASHTGVDNVRENIIASARTFPTRCKYKVFIIDEVHMLSISAFNALLKIIEEPPEYVIFILCTTEIHKVPTTIISRCQRFDFKRISVTDMVKKLNYIVKEENIKIEKKILEAIARHSDGHMRDAEGLLGQIVAIGGREITQEEADLVIPRSDVGEIINLIDFLAKKDCGGGIDLINKLVDDGIDLKTFISDLIEVLRKIMLGKINPGLAEKLGLELGETLEMKVGEVSKNLTLEQIINFLEKFIEIKNKVKDSFIQQLPIELVITEVCMAISPSARNIAGERSSSREPLAAQNNPTVARSTPAAKAAVVNFNQDQLLAKWNEVLARVKKHNHSLSFILRACEPRDINGNQLCLAFKYKFHQDRINNLEIKKIVEQVLNEVYGLPLVIEAIIDENLEINNGNGQRTLHPPAGGGGQAANEPSKGAGRQPTGDEVVGKKDGGGKKDGMVDNLLNIFGGKVIK